MTSMNNRRNSFKVLSRTALCIRILDAGGSSHLHAGEEYLMVKAQELSPERCPCGTKLLMARPGEYKACYASGILRRITQNPFMAHVYTAETFSSCFTFEVLQPDEDGYLPF